MNLRSFYGSDDDIGNESFEGNGYCDGCVVC